jgi:hypothetical protein
LLLSAIVVLCCSTLSVDVSKVSEPENTAKTAALHSLEAGGAGKDAATLPDSPVAKTSDGTNSDNAAVISPAISGSAAVQPFSNSPVRSAGRSSLETPRERNIWYALLAVSHGAAVFDAYSTRRAISGNYGVEGNPLLRPFSHCNVIYAATQVSPAIMDYVGHRMLKSHNTLLRRFWWLPQTAGASFSVGAGIHNYRLVP